MTKLPNFLIVGAAKSGTTSLYEYLRTHPQVFMPSWKEPAHFEPKAGGVKLWTDYCKLFEGAEKYDRVGEASVSYLMSAEAPERIMRALGCDIDIIVLLRNPVTMAYSLWGHEVREGFEHLGFVEALRDEERRLTEENYEKAVCRWRYDMTYLHRARYSPQLLRYFDFFEKRRVHIYLYEEFFEAGSHLYSDLLQKLGLDVSHRPVESVHNKAGSVRSTLLRRVLSERASWKEPLKRIIPSHIRNHVTSSLSRFNRVDRPLPPVPLEAANMIKGELKEDVELLSSFMGRDLKQAWGWQ